MAAPRARGFAEQRAHRGLDVFGRIAAKSGSARAGRAAGWPASGAGSVATGIRLDCQSPAGMANDRAPQRRAAGCGTWRRLRPHSHRRRQRRAGLRAARRRVRRARAGDRVRTGSAAPASTSAACRRSSCGTRRSWRTRLDDAHDYGFDLTLPATTGPRCRRKRDAYIERLNGIYARQPRAAQRAAAARARAADGGTDRARRAAAEYRAPHIVLATGGRPVVPAIPGAELGITSDGFFELPGRPARVAIVGSGYIAVELAGVFAALGSHTTLVLRGERLLRHFEPFLGEHLRESMAAEGVGDRHRTRLPTALQRGGDGACSSSSPTGAGSAPSTACCGRSAASPPAPGSGSSRCRGARRRRLRARRRLPGHQRARALRDRRCHRARCS